MNTKEISPEQFERSEILFRRIQAHREALTGALTLAQKLVHRKMIAALDAARREILGVTADSPE